MNTDLDWTEELILSRLSALFKSDDDKLHPKIVFHLFYNNTAYYFRVCLCEGELHFSSTSYQGMLYPC